MPVNHPPWTVEEARQHQRKAVESRRANALAKIAALPENQPPASPEEFRQQRLGRVRSQLDLVDTAIENEGKRPHPDGQRIDRLVAASSRLAEQHRQLAGWSLPVTLSKRLDSQDTRPASVLSVVDLPALPSPQPTPLPEQDKPAC